MSDKLGFEMADRVSNGAPGGEERSSGATKKKPKAFSTPMQRPPTPALLTAAVGGAGSPGEKSSMFKRVDSVRRSMGLTKKEKSPRRPPLTFSPDAEVQKVTKGSEVSQSYTLSPDPSASPSGAASPGMNAIFKREWLASQRSPCESYTLPPGPSAPPSVMEVNNLIDGCDLLGALVNLLSLREEVRNASPVELAHLEKDLHPCLCARTKMAACRRQSSVLPAHNKGCWVQVTEVKDSYALLDFIGNQYESERILGNVGLQPEMREELRHLTLEEELLNKIKDQYCKQLQAEVKALLEGVIRVERETLWEPKTKSKEHDEAKCPLSPMVMDIRQMVAGKEKTSRTLSTDLGLRTTHICLKELERFPTELEREFSCCVRPLISPPADVLDQSLWVTYHITYINSFIALREHMESYKDSSPDQVTQLSRSLEKAKSKLTHTLLQQLKTDISPFTASLMTKHWLNDDEDFKELCERVQNLYDLCTEMKQPQLQEFVKQLHLLVMREYVTPLLHSSYSCKGRKNQQAAEKLQEQWTQLSTLFQRMKSSEDWLHPLGDHLSKIIGQKNESDITKAILQPLVTDFPDISEKQLQAVLNFRASMWTPERIRVQHRVAKLKQQGGATHTHIRFFTEMQ
ncbi:hypothetical protein AALO_G00000360 [Alosa alosa]|uniref:Uncharacterized protein n=1 Tax=Alosa alosa TaxID=278164 RepID=A0AAV6HFB6_9TELE|nr:hypothetical protein AALO_G00000360 [Alosa alosa]